MRIGAALDLAPEHPGHRHVGAEIGAAGDLVDAVGADRAGADEAQRGFIEIAHGLTPSLLAPARSRNTVGRVERSATRHCFASDTWRVALRSTRPTRGFPLRSRRWRVLAAHNGRP